MARANKSCLTLTNWTFGSLTININSLSNKCWPYCPMNIEYQFQISPKLMTLFVYPINPILANSGHKMTKEVF